MLLFHEIGNWEPGQLRVRWIESSFPTIPEVQTIIETTWHEATARPGMHLFDGAMCRLEAFRRDGDLLDIELSRTSYKPFYGTNLTHPELADRYGQRVLACPVGVSPALITMDSFLLLGRRNASVAYYPNRLHPFAGALEPPAPGETLDIFDELRRELREELHLRDAQITRVSCTGIVEDTRLRQPEMIFAATTSLSRAKIETQVHDEEHDDAWSVPASAQALQAALQSDEPFTPVARAAMLLWGRLEFGDAWFSALRDQ